MKDLVIFWIFLIIYSQRTSVAEWEFTSSEDKIMAGESFPLTCSPDSDIRSIIWTRYDFTKSEYLANVTMSMTTGKCLIAGRFDKRYQYTCKPGPICQLIVPKNESIFADLYNTYWQCGSRRDGIHFDHTSSLSQIVYQPVRKVMISGPSVMYKHISKTFRCSSDYGYPRPIITLATTGKTDGSLSFKFDWKTSGRLSISFAEQRIKASDDTEQEFVNCSAYNVQEREPVNETFIFNVYYAPSIEPMIYGYTNLSKIYETDELILTCQQAGGKPLSNITWECFGFPETINSSDTISSSYIKLRIDRSMNNRTCVCSVEHPDVIVSYSRKVVVSFNVQFMDLTSKNETVTVSSKEDIFLECIANGHPSIFTFNSWTHMIGTRVIRTLSGLSNRNSTTLKLLLSSFQDSGIYVCSADNSNGEHVKNNTIEVTVTGVPIVTKTRGNNIDTIYVEFYSIPKPHNIEWIKEGKILFDSEKYQRAMSMVDVNITIHGVKVVTKGYRAQLLVRKPAEIDYGKYVVVIKNQIGKTEQEVMFENKTTSTVIPWIGIISGVTSSFVLVIIIILVFCFIKRRRNDSAEYSVVLSSMPSKS